MAQIPCNCKRTALLVVLIVSCDTTQRVWKSHAVLSNLSRPVEITLSNYAVTKSCGSD